MLRRIQAPYRLNAQNVKHIQIHSHSTVIFAVMHFIVVNRAELIINMFIVKNNANKIHFQK